MLLLEYSIDLDMNELTIDAAIRPDSPRLTPGYSVQGHRRWLETVAEFAVYVYMYKQMQCTIHVHV